MNVKKPNNHVTPRTGSSIAVRRNQAFTCLAHGLARDMLALNCAALFIWRNKKINKIELIWKREQNIARNIRYLFHR